MKETGWCCGKLPSITRRRPLQSLYKTTASIVPFIPGQLTSGGALNSCPLLYFAIWPYQFWRMKDEETLFVMPASQFGPAGDSGLVSLPFLSKEFLAECLFLKDDGVGSSRRDILLGI